MSAPTNYAVWSAAGASVAIGARRSDITAESVAEIKAVCPPPAATGQQVIGVSLDVTDAASIEAAYAEVVGAFGQLDILVNNAGRSAGGAFETHSDEDWQADLDVKLFAMIRLTRLAFPAMKERGWGRVITVLNTVSDEPSLIYIVELYSAHCHSHAASTTACRRCCGIGKVCMRQQAIHAIPSITST
jgi:NAD(P)-dependent dehydrogenase (short-subunit alcohol dehydrogenase family)